MQELVQQRTTTEEARQQLARYAQRELAVQTSEAKHRCEMQALESRAVTAENALQSSQHQVRPCKFCVVRIIKLWPCTCVVAEKCACQISNDNALNQILAELERSLLSSEAT